MAVPEVQDRAGITSSTDQIDVELRHGVRLGRILGSRSFLFEKKHVLDDERVRLLDPHKAETADFDQRSLPFRVEPSVGAPCAALGCRFGFVDYPHGPSISLRCRFTTTQLPSHSRRSLHL